MGNYNGHLMTVEAWGLKKTQTKAVANAVTEWFEENTNFETSTFERSFDKGHLTLRGVAGFGGWIPAEPKWDRLITVLEWWNQSSLNDPDLYAAPGIVEGVAAAIGGRPQVVVLKAWPLSGPSHWGYGDAGALWGEWEKLPYDARGEGWEAASPDEPRHYFIRIGLDFESQYQSPDVEMPDDWNDVINPVRKAVEATVPWRGEARLEEAYDYRMEIRGEVEFLAGQSFVDAVQEWIAAVRGAAGSLLPPKGRIEGHNLARPVYQSVFTAS